MKRGRGLYGILRKPNPVWKCSKSSLIKMTFPLGPEGVTQWSAGRRGLFLAEETMCWRKRRKVRVTGVW